MRVALTGATGFVGRKTLERLLDAGHEVKALARRPDVLPINDRCVAIKGDLADENALAALVQGADVVLHVAGAVSAPTRADFFRTNVEGSKRVAEAALDAGAKRFVFVSSLAAREPALNDYAASKAEAERVLVGFASRMEITIIRPSAVYGPGDTATLPLLQALLSKVALIPGTRESRFSMVHVDDVAQVLSEAIAGETGVFELDDGMSAHGWHELVALTQQHFGKPQSQIYIPRDLAMALGNAGTLWGRLRGKSAMVNAGQMKQLYHADWAVRGEPWPLKRRIPLTQGLPDTIRWYQERGMLPLRGAVDRSAQTGKP
jgi:nucleoside-diphosphate-sugar epimerase